MALPSCRTANLWQVHPILGTQIPGTVTGVDLVIDNFVYQTGHGVNADFGVQARLLVTCGGVGVDDAADLPKENSLPVKKRLFNPERADECEEPFQ